jgi:hypothetical protein
MWKRRTKRSGRREKIHLILGGSGGITWECKIFMEKDVREWKMMYVIGVILMEDG